MSPRTAALEARPWWQIVCVCGAIAALAATGAGDERRFIVGLGLGCCALLLHILISRNAAGSGILHAAWTHVEPRAAQRASWFAAGACVTLIGLVLVELRDAPFFLQDDNYDQFLPVIAWAGRSLAEGIFPVWNPHQFLGSPTAEIGTYALTYPITYLALGCAHLLGHVEWTFEVFAFLHLLAGYSATFWAARRIGLAAPLASAAAFCFALSGYHLIAGRNWYYMLPVAVWAPLLIGLVARLAERRVSFGWFALTSFVIGAFFHAGNAQMWTYAMLFFAVAVASLTVRRAISVRRAAWAALAAISGIGLAAPLLVPQFLFTRGLERTLWSGGNISKGLIAIVAPFGLASAPHPMAGTWASRSLLMDHAQMFCAGSLFPTLALGGFVLLIAARPAQRIPDALTWLLMCGLLAFLGALGTSGGLWPVMARLPVFKSFQLPYKLLGFFNLYACLAGALMFQRAVAQWRRQRLATLAAWASCAAIILYAAAGPLPSNWSWSERAYQPLPAVLREHLRHDPRVLPLGTGRSNETEFPLSLQLNMATIYGAFSFLGYDPFVEATAETRRARNRLRADPKSAVEAFGMRHVLVRVDKPSRDDDWFGTWLPPSAAPTGARVEAKVAHASLLEVPSAAPAVFSAEAPTRPLPCVVNGRGVRAEVPQSAAPRSVIFNFLHRPGFVAFDAEGRSLALSADDWGRMQVEVPQQATAVEVRYVAPFGLGFALGSLLLGISTTAAVALHRTRRSED